MNAPLLLMDSVPLHQAGGLPPRALTWRILPGESWAVLGPNGSGKSQIASLLLGTLHPGSGSVRFAWGDPGEERHAVAVVSPEAQRELLGTCDGYYQARYESLGTSLGMLVRDCLTRQHLEGLNPFEVLPRRPAPRPFPLSRNQVLRELRIAPLLRRRLHELSNGEQRRLLIALALLRRPRLLVLDDPFAGLDVATQAHVRHLVEQLSQRRIPLILLAPDQTRLPKGITRVLHLNQRIRSSRPPPGELTDTRIQPRKSRPPRAPARDKPPRPAPRNSETRDHSPILLLRNATVRYGRHCVLHNIHWTVRPGEQWAVLGPNGSGKSTLLSLVLGDHPQSHAVDLTLFNRQPGHGLSRWDWLKDIGFLSPELHQHQPPTLSLLDIVASGLHGTLGLYRHVGARNTQRALDALATCGVRADPHAAYGNLPLGTQRLVLLARAWVKQPRLLILDEPCQGLDPRQRRRVVRLLDRLGRPGHTHLIVVTHRRDELPACTNRILRLHQGRATAHHAPS